MQRDHWAGINHSEFISCKYWVSMPNTIPMLATYKVWTICVKIYLKSPQILFMFTQFLNFWWTIVIKICTQENLMGWKWKSIKWWELYKSKILNFIIIFKLKKFKVSIFFYLGQSLFGEKWVVKCVGFYGMDLSSKDGNGGLKRVFGSWELLSLNY